MTTTGSCHSGKSRSHHVRFRQNSRAALAPSAPSVVRCTLTISQASSSVDSAADDVTYRWNTKLVVHHSCSACGIATFSDSPAFNR